MSTQIITRLKAYTDSIHTPIDDLKAVRQNDPFRTLIQTILTAQTRDSLTAPLTKKLFENVGDTPKNFAHLDEDALMEQLYPITYYKTKAKHIIHTCQILIEKFNGQVPRTLSELTSLPGVGPKTASVVLAESFGIPAIVVDTHVHRISNRIGFVHTKNREQTVKALQVKLPLNQWNDYNAIFVKMGQTICTPVSPKCSICPAKDICPKIGVESHR